MRFLKCQLGETANRGSGLVSKLAKHQIRAKSHKLHHSSGLRVMLWKVLLLFHQCKVSIMNQRLITINGTGWQCTCPGELRKFRSWVERSGDTRIGEFIHFLSRLWSFSIIMFPQMRLLALVEPAEVIGLANVITRCVHRRLLSATYQQPPH